MSSFGSNSPPYHYIYHILSKITLSHDASNNLEYQPSIFEWKERLINMINTARKALSTIEA